jgi:GT2 family glycosyltransferase
MPNRPLLSVILTTRERYSAIRKTVSCLRKQTACGQIELVIVAPSRSRLELDERQLAEFAGYQVVEIDRFKSIGHSNAEGIRHANAAIVALAEDHCFPDPQWAERLIASHQGPWAAVGPGIRNANPKTAVSWADLFIGYGPWLAPSPSRETEYLPGHNASYKRAVLLEYGDQLDSLMDAETVLHWNLRSKGHRLFLDSQACVAHTNFSLWASWLPAQLHNGRLFAGTRALQKPLSWRILFTLGAPLIPAVRLARIWAAISSKELRRRFLSSIHAVAIGLVVDGMGQMIGYALGAGENTSERVGRYEMERFRHIREQERREILEVD